MSNEKNQIVPSNQEWTAPEYNKDAFHCPHCNVYSHHRWVCVYLYNTSFYKDYSVAQILENNFKGIDEKTGQIQDSVFSFCDHCKKYSIWVNQKMVYPDSSLAPLPIEEMPPSVKELYHEARGIVSKSPRGACALLRLAVHTLIKKLGESESNLNKAIENLVKKGLPEKIEKALHVVRVIGNNAVHPGKINIEDKPEIASSLFMLLNFISEKIITEPKKVDDIHGSLPENKKSAINKRDKK